MSTLLLRVTLEQAVETMFSVVQLVFLGDDDYNWTQVMPFEYLLD